MKYDAFGKIVWLDATFGVKAASDYGWNRTFTGQVLDGETGLMLYRNRLYNTELGRFVNRDPIDYRSGNINIYYYVIP
jgi:RHS repeat-associated protein